MKTLKQQYGELKNDERLSYPKATVVENTPLALIQLEGETKLALLKSIILDMKKDWQRTRDKAILSVNQELIDSGELLYIQEFTGYTPPELSLSDEEFTKRLL